MKERIQWFDLLGDTYVPSSSSHTGFNKNAISVLLPLYCMILDPKLTTTAALDVFVLEENHPIQKVMKRGNSQSQVMIKGRRMFACIRQASSATLIT